MKTSFNLALVGQDGNAFSIMGRFSKEAKRAGWTAEEVAEETHRMMAGDYNNLLAVVMEWTNDPDEDEYEEYED